IVASRVVPAACLKLKQTGAFSEAVRGGAPIRQRIDLGLLSILTAAYNVETTCRSTRIGEACRNGLERLVRLDETPDWTRRVDARQLYHVSSPSVSDLYSSERASENSAVHNLVPPGKLSVFKGHK
ncbi:hypothetical protein ACJX0J_036402, partial [Zea mays]